MVEQGGPKAADDIEEPQSERSTEAGPGQDPHSSTTTRPPPASGWLRSWVRLHQDAQRDRVALLVLTGVVCGLTLPFLGSVGFFDPWETHYAEVARQMAARNDYLYPFWKDAYFFSKPVLLFWLTSIGYTLLGAGQATDAIPYGAEFVGRLPNALFGISTVITVFLTARRLWGTRAAMLSGLVLSTVPFWLFMSRQAITDMLYVGPTSMALCVLAVAFFDDDSRERLQKSRLPGWLVSLFGLALLPQLWEIGRSGAFLNRTTVMGGEFAARTAFSVALCTMAATGLFWLWKRGRDPLVHGAAFLVAIGTLGKGPHALLLTGMVLFLYFVASGEWRLLRRPALITGIALYLVVSLPWYIVMAFFDGRDDSRKTWVGRFIFWDLFGRIGVGVHGDRGTFEYYFRYLGFGMFPWSGFFPVALLKAASERLGQSAERTPRQRFTLFVMLWAASYFVFFTATTTKFHHYIFPVVVPAALLIGWWLDSLLRNPSRVQVGIAAALVLASILIARDLAAEPWQLVDLFTYHYKSWKPDYYFPTDRNWHLWFSVAGFTATGILVWGIFADAARQRFHDVSEAEKPLLVRWLTPWSQVGSVTTTGTHSQSNGGFVLGSVLAALWFSVFAVHVYFNGMSQHWSQRWIFDTYYALRRPGEPIISYQMDWKGETFYAHNEDIQIKKSASDLKKRVEKPGREFILVQTDRFSRIESALGSAYKDKIHVVDRSNKKWFLVLVDE